MFTEEGYIVFCRNRLTKGQRSLVIMTAASEAVAVFIKHGLTFREMKTAMGEIRQQYEDMVNDSEVSAELAPAMQTRVGDCQRYVDARKRQLTEALGEQALKTNEDTA